jgi:hypothetical protein
MQRFGSALHLNLHFHCVFLEGVYLDRTAQGRKPRFVTAEPPTDADIAAVCSCGAGDVVHKISRRIIRKLRRLGYLEAGTEDVVATGHDPRRDDAPELAQTLATSVQQHLAFGERAGQRVRRLGAGFGVDGEAPTLTGPRCASVQGFSFHANTQVSAHRRDQLERLLRYSARGAVSLERLPHDAHGDLVSTFTPPWSDGTTGIRLSPLALLEKLAALVPLPRMHLVRYGGCLAPHSHWRGAIVPTPRQPGMTDEAPVKLSTDPLLLPRRVSGRALWPGPRPEVPLARPGGGRPLAILHDPVLFALSNPSADAARHRGGCAHLSRSDRRGRCLPHVRRSARRPSHPRRRPSAAPSALPALCISLFLHLSLQQSPLQRRRLSSTHPQPAGPAAVWRCWLLGACRWRGVLRQPGWWPPEPARHWDAERLEGARCGETPALGSRAKWLSFSYPLIDASITLNASPRF